MEPDIPMSASLPYFLGSCFSSSSSSLLIDKCEGLLFLVGTFLPFSHDGSADLSSSFISSLEWRESIFMILSSWLDYYDSDSSEPISSEE